MHTPTATAHEEDRPLRADARRNRQRILEAATELFVEQGLDVPLEAVARRADVGIATLYRRFSDRQELAGAVAMEAFTSVRRLAEGSADPDRPGDADALRRFMRGVADLRIGVLMASLLPVMHEVTADEELADAFDDMVAAVTALCARAHASGELRPDATADDVMLLLAMLTRPLQGVPGSFCEAVTPRLLHLVIEGLHPTARPTPPPPAPATPDPGAVADWADPHC